jgi:hypothetical protein
MAESTTQGIQQEAGNTAFTLLPAWGWCPAGSDQAPKALVRAMIVQAARDAQKDNIVGQSARAWLTGEDCALYAVFAGVNHNAIRAWVIAGGPKPAERVNRWPGRTEKALKASGYRKAPKT